MHWSQLIHPLGFIASSLKESDELFACEFFWGLLRLDSMFCPI